MKVSRIDPRTYLVEATPVAYRVDIWTPIGDPVNGGWSSAEYRLEPEDLDVDSVVAWAATQAVGPGMQVVVYAEVPEAASGRRLLVRLSGKEPTSSSESVDE
ncbi:MAG: hypothetical protein WAL50_06335 [Kineosporiaceae bacterium]